MGYITETRPRSLFRPRLAGELFPGLMYRVTDNPIVGSDAFGLSKRHILAARKEAHRLIKNAKRELKQPSRRDINDFALQRVQQSAQKDIEFSQMTLAKLRGNPDQVLKKLRSMYNTIRQLEESCGTRPELNAQLAATYPDLGDYYMVLERTGWGERAAGAVINARDRREYLGG